MRQLVLNIPEKDYSFFLKVVQSFSFVEIDTQKKEVFELESELHHENENSDNIEIPEIQKQIVRDRIKASEANPSRLLNWDLVKHSIKC